MGTVAAIQMASGPNISANLTEVSRLISDAAATGAGLIVLPENFAMMGITEQDKVGIKESDGEGPIQDFLAMEAERHAIWLVGGTVPLLTDNPEKVSASCLLFNDKGERVARYDKIHLFDVEIQETGEHYIESETIEPGEKVVVVDTPFGRLGLAVCYDLRFPELFRRMLDDGMEVLALPSAFTAITGKAHWESLLRARAIENLSYVIASAQGGYHVNGRETHGHSVIIDPWGAILDELPSGSGFVCADIDMENVSSTRRTFPTIAHRRMPCNLP
ncbi:MAG: carbon-nitrogen hydrolase family protein [Gammaproteobacteria bacterium]|nr:MAG: carbon-nitrogen hydrolase family protein [Gammaproteobacteria bacterium]